MPGRHPHKKTTAQFIAQARAKHADKFDYSCVQYVNAKTHVSIRCPSHGSYEQLPDVHLVGTGCPRCRYQRMSRSRARPWSDVLSQFKETHGDRYDYRSVQYVNTTRKVTIVCRKHGPFQQRPYCHIQGHGCPRCKYDLLSEKQRLSLEEILDRFRQAHGDRYDYSQVVQVRNTSHKVTIVCKKHGDFEQTVASHSSGSGCSACQESHGERRVAMTLKQLQLHYVRQKRFSSCRDIKPLPFDFHVPEYDTLIEYDGQQHFVASKRFDLRTIQRHDAIKTEWAHRNGFPLIRIPNKQYQAIPIILQTAFSKA